MGTILDKLESTNIDIEMLEAVINMRKGKSYKSCSTNKSNSTYNTDRKSSTEEENNKQLEEISSQLAKLCTVAEFVGKTIEPKQEKVQSDYHTTISNDFGGFDSAVLEPSTIPVTHTSKLMSSNPPSKMFKFSLSATRNNEIDTSGSIFSEPKLRAEDAFQNIYKRLKISDTTEFDIDEIQAKREYII